MGKTTIADLKQELDDKGVEYKSNAKLAELKELVLESMSNNVQDISDEEEIIVDDEFIEVEPIVEVEEPIVEADEEEIIVDDESIEVEPIVEVEEPIVEVESIGTYINISGKTQVMHNPDKTLRYIGAGDIIDSSYKSNRFVFSF